MLLRAADASMPVALEAVCSRAMAKHPADRFETAEAMASDLRGWLDDSRRKRRWLIRGLAALVVVSVIGAVVAWAIQGSSFVRDGAIHFDGRTRIVTPVERKLPVTLEAWVRPDPYEGTDCQFVIGSDVPKLYGIGVGICGSVFSAEYQGGMINSSAAVPPGEWSHLGGVFTETESRLYLNGKLVHTGTGGKSDGTVTNFVIGDVGLSNPIAKFHGEIRAVRISQGERYTGDFKPSDKITGDQETIAVYSAEGISGRVVRDLSGNGNDASIETTAK